MVRDMLLGTAGLEFVQPGTAASGAGAERLRQMLAARAASSDPVLRP